MIIKKCTYKYIFRKQWITHDFNNITRTPKICRRQQYTSADQIWCGWSIMVMRTMCRNGFRVNLPTVSLLPNKYVSDRVVPMFAFTPLLHRASGSRLNLVRSRRIHQLQRIAVRWKAGRGAGRGCRSSAGLRRFHKLSPMQLLTSQIGANLKPATGSFCLFD